MSGPVVVMLTSRRRRSSESLPRLAGRPISAIAYSCGFGDLSGFNRAFKEAYGVSPRELRNASAAGG
jgi:AraC-like DNA-binding protein